MCSIPHPHLPHRVRSSHGNAVARIPRPWRPRACAAPRRHRRFHRRPTQRRFLSRFPPAISPVGCEAKRFSFRKTYPTRARRRKWRPRRRSNLVETVPVEQTAADGAAPAEEAITDGSAPTDTAATADSGVDPALATDPAAQAPVADPAMAPAAATVTADPGAADPAAPASAPAELIDPATSAPAPAEVVDAAPLVDAATTELVADGAPAATPVPLTDESAASGDATIEASPAPEAEVTPIPQPELNPTGPASVTVDAPIRVGPSLQLRPHLHRSERQHRRARRAMWSMAMSPCSTRR